MGPKPNENAGLFGSKQKQNKNVIVSPYNGHLYTVHMKQHEFWPDLILFRVQSRFKLKRKEKKRKEKVARPRHVSTCKSRMRPLYAMNPLRDVPRMGRSKTLCAEETLEKVRL